MTSFLLQDFEISYLKNYMYFHLLTRNL